MLMNRISLLHLFSTQTKGPEGLSLFSSKRSGGVLRPGGKRAFNGNFVINLNGALLVRSALLGGR
jgi:hypothetical protein